LTIHDLFKLGLKEVDHDAFLDDESCIKKIGEIAGNRGISELLPSQIYSLITTFLRGKPELIGVSIDELNAIISEKEQHSSHYRVYGEFLQDIRQP